MRQYVENNYDFTPELLFSGKKYGWTIRYRKSGKTLCSLLPEKGAFTVLVVLGGKEVDNWEPIRFLLGEWKGEGEESKVEHAYEFILQDKFIHSRTRAEFEPKEGEEKGEVSYKISDSRG